MQSLAGKKALIVGVANDKSLAYFIAENLKEQGAEIAIVYQSAAHGRRAIPLAEKLGVKFHAACDVNQAQEITSLFETVKKNWSEIDILIHAVAYAPTEELTERLVNLSKNGFQVAMETSVYSLVELSRHALPLMKQGGSILTLTNSGSERVVPNYGVMGLAKAALESLVRYLAADLGPDKIRVNAISAGPIKTLSAGGISNFREYLEMAEKRAPLQENITGQDVSEMATFLSSERAKHITGSIFYVDSGIHILGA